MTYFTDIKIKGNTSNLLAETKANSNTLNNELIVNLQGHECADNTTTTPLGISGVFTGAGWQDTLDYGVLSINVVSDKASAPDGLDIQWSNDGVNVADHDYFTISASIAKTFTFGPAQRYYRVVYTNGVVAQTTFNLTSILRKVYVKPSSHRISDSIVAEDDAELTKSIITGRNDNGVYNNVSISNSNRMNVLAQSYGYAVAEGDIIGHTGLLKYGTRTSVLAGVSSTVWEGNTAIYAYMSTSQQLKISSSSALDTAAGTGARTLTIYGLDANYDEINETITLTGTSVVTTTLSYLRIFRAFVVTCGTGYTNAGKIIITNNAGTAEQLVINTGDGQTLMSMWTVPRNKTAYIMRGSVSTDSNKGARISFFTRKLDGGTLYAWLIKYRGFIFSGASQILLEIPLVLPEKTDLEIRVLTPGSAGTTSVGGTFELWYE